MGRVVAVSGRVYRLRSSWLSSTDCWTILWGRAIRAWCSMTGAVARVDGAGGVTYLTPASIRQAPERTGLPATLAATGVEHQRPQKMLESMRASVINDFKSNTVAFRCRRVPLQARLRDPVLKSSPWQVRPVDIRMGRMAIYVADFYNNVICHQTTTFVTRHATCNGRSAGAGEKMLAQARHSPGPTGQLLDMLKAPERWTRQQAKFNSVNATAHSCATWPIAGFAAWMPTSRITAATCSRLFICATAEAASPQLLERAVLPTTIGPRLRGTTPSLVRLAGEHARVARGWPRRCHLQVRLEAIPPADKSPGGVFNSRDRGSRHSRDRWIDYAFTQAVRHQERRWSPGHHAPPDRRGHQPMLAVLEKGGSKQMLSRR